MKTQRYLLLLLFCLATLSILGQTIPSFADKRVALVIGNGSYQYTPALINPPSDAKDVAEALKAIGFDVTLKVDVEKRQLDQVIAQFAREGKTADAVLFYYAGHGMQFAGKNFLMPVDAELQDEISLRYEMIALDDVKSALQLSPGVKIMVLDACRDNPQADKFVRSISVSTRDVPKVQGYARPERAQGMIIVYATQADDVAQDGGGRNSPFTQAFLKEIKEPGLEVGAMFRRIGADVYAATNGRQSPELSISMAPEYYLNQSETDQTIWARIRTRADAGTLHEFLDRYPSSFYAPDARASSERRGRRRTGRLLRARCKREIRTLRAFGTNRRGASRRLPTRAPASAICPQSLRRRKRSASGSPRNWRNERPSRRRRKRATEPNSIVCRRSASNARPISARKSTRSRRPPPNRTRIAWCARLSTGSAAARRTRTRRGRSASVSRTRSAPASCRSRPIASTR